MLYYTHKCSKCRLCALEQRRNLEIQACVAFARYCYLQDIVSNSSQARFQIVNRVCVMFTALKLC